MFRRHLTHDSHRKAWARERMPPEEIFRDTQLTSDRADFVLEEFPQRLDELQIHAFGETAHVMVTLDHGGGAAHRDGFDDVRVQGPLHEVFDAPEPFRLLLEDFYKDPADYSPLLFRVRDAFERPEEFLRGVHAHHV